MKKMKIKSNSSKSRKRKIIDTIAILGLSCIVIVSLFGFMTLNVILKESEPFKESLLQGDQATVLYAKTLKVKMKYSINYQVEMEFVKTLLITNYLKLSSMLS